MAIACASRWPFPTPTGSGCRTSASRRSTACSTPKTTSSASGCSCRRSRSWPSSSPAARRCVTLESQTPVGEFDVFAFSVSFEWDYVNVLTLLRLAGIPAARGRAHRAPSADRHRRRGDVRQSRAAGAVCRRHRRRRRRSARAGAATVRSRAASDRASCSVPARAERGFYVPSFYEPQYASDGTLEPATSPTRRHRRAAAGPEGRAEDHRRRRSAGDEHLHARHRVRIALPRRSRPRLREPVPLLLGRLQLPAGPRVSRPIASCSSPKRRGRTRTAPASCRSRSAIIRTSSASSRACSRWATRSARPRCGSTICTDRSSGCCAQSGERTITIAPETGSDRLRRVINKTVTNDEILDRAELIFASGIENLKLYYMIGLPTETDDDLVAIRDLTLQLRERMLKHARAARPDRPHHRQRQPADPEAGHRVPVAADGRRTP